MTKEVPTGAAAAVLVQSAPIPEGTAKVEGYNFDSGVDWQKIFNSYPTLGYQGTSLGDAIRIIDEMLNWRLSHDPIADDENEEFRDMAVREKTKCKIFLGYTSNLVSSGLREMIRFLVQHKLVDVIVTTAGGVEEDIIKCLGNTYVGDFALRGADLRKKGMNRIGNLLVPNDNYCKFEDWVLPVLDEMLEEQKTKNVNWTPSKVNHRLGERINNPSSIYYWAAKNNIPVYCPALTDGSLGDMIYFHSYKNPGLVVDIVGDIKSINDQAVFAKKTGMVILGGGVVKHHICNANLMRNGADYAVYVNTGQEFDGSDAGARPDEAVSWGKIRANAKSVKVFADATIVFPILVGMTFAKQVEEKNDSSVDTVNDAH
ncbi:deoxyhypusine synthase [Paraphysoderma sedebokerense]|nr:deoxyhypusine synthase [Paraphysoderma sedebokerense]KAI9142347.1 deoxyhypusine synthase [Paraphysoderma sedebokerense]